MNFCQQTFNDIYFETFSNYVTPIGVFFNILSIIGLAVSSEMKFNLFRYLIVKGISDLLFLLTTDLIFYYNGLSLNHSYGGCRFGYSSIIYIQMASEGLSMICEVAAYFNRYRVITEKFQFMNKIHFWLKLGALCIICLAYYIYWFFAYDCQQI